MSNEFFQTFLTADVRTAPNGRDVEYAESDTKNPRKYSVSNGTMVFNPEVDDRSRTWSSCYLYVHDVLEICATEVGGQEMEGLTGDHPKKRDQAADLIRSVAHMVKHLAGDAAFDGSITDDHWDILLTSLQAQVTEYMETRIGP